MYEECSPSISIEIICFEHLQQGSYEQVNPGIFLQEYVQLNASQVAIMMAFWKIMCFVLQVEISHPHITSHILFAKGFKNLRRE